MIPTIDPKWRTSTVVSLCQAMREERNYSAMPILADALQDADCDNEELLARLRSASPSYRDDERVVAIIMSDEGSKAVEWMDKFAEELGPNYGYEEEDREEGSQVEEMTYTSLMGYAQDYDENGEYKTQYGSQSWQDRMYSTETCREFWEHYQMITGIAVKNSEARFFSCSC